ncbi:MAG: hypothetical protein IKX76_05055 [Eubacterium sp.]|nr:hypothetical protein [Eubacterium sp.]
MCGFLRDFHRKTMESYRKGMEEEMEDWKKRVLKIHEEAAFLFYVDEMEEDPERAVLCLVRGELVKGFLEEGEKILLLDGEGNRLAGARIRSHVEEKEDRRSGLLKRKRNEFVLELTDISGRDAGGLSETDQRRLLQSLFFKISLIMEDS